MQMYFLKMKSYLLLEILLHDDDYNPKRIL